MKTQVVGVGALILLLGAPDTNGQVETSAAPLPDAQRSVLSHTATTPETIQTDDGAAEATSSFSSLPLNAGPQMFFDASSTGLTRDGKQQVFKGDVVAVGSGLLLTADEITLNRTSNMLEAKGHVMILTENQIFIGDRVNYQIVTGDFKLFSATMVVNDKATAEKASRKVLGFTPAEIAFEEQKVQRLKVIDQRKAKLRDRFLEDANAGSKTPNAEVVDGYSLLLEQEDLTKQQENPFLSKMSQDRRRRYKARRLYWQKGREETQQLQSKAKVTAFFRIEGKTLERRNGNDYEAEEAFWTPCKCDEDENPAWGFRSSKLEGQMEGYLDFYHPVLEIKGMPVLYLPYMRVPVKEKRQSGLLMPTFAQRSSSGNIYSQPIYLAIDDHFDATVTSEIYEKRGTKVALETRYQQKKYSGWTLQLEGMRDRVWMEDRRRRADASERYFGDNQAEIRNLCAAEAKGDPNREAQCIRLAKRQLSIPENDWRSAQIWSGMSILAPRLSFVSKGKLYSDHRYVEDLTLYEDFQSALEASSRATMFSTSRYGVHLDAKNFYLGTGGAFGDNVLATDRFQGQQLPYQVRSQTRLMSLDRGLSPIPIYGQMSAQHYQIADFRGQNEETPELDGENRTLGEGHWQRAKFDQSSPLLTKGIFKLDEFFEWEARSIAHSRLSEPRSSIRTWRTGVTLNLPIDGEGRIPNWFILNRKDDAFGSPHVRHYMNWAVNFSIRPDVYRSGPYGQFRNLYYDNGTYREGGELVYFASDRSETNSGDDRDIEANDTMRRHKRVQFSTAHTWDFFNRGWEKIPGAPNRDQTDGSPQQETYQERARRELLDSVDRNIGSVKDMFDEDRQQFFINRYRLSDQGRSRVAEARADIAYDFIDEKRREAEKAKRANGELADTGQVGLSQPWSTPNSYIRISLFNTVLINELRYNLYYRKTVDQKFSLQLPTYLSTAVTFGYNVGNEPYYNEESGNLDFILTQEPYTKISTGIVPNIMLKSWLGRRFKGGAKTDYQTVLGVEYMSPSDCWQLAFQRQKKYGSEEKDVEYLLQLSVLFLGQARSARVSPRDWTEREPQKISSLD